ncbi:sensor histidine kinase [Aliarcobacter cryaerophilus]|uniref:sensor histidine kinase n=1 Tax=Aliarcobacter cryaerophilus TaxID=28198 RepID=UPI0011DF3CBE|nr:ATP-binding protein [Aliarcobacter cryaerophilus]MCT7504888.1 ATP-binding protein [Aliarcobacter cryaerophilus]MCT7507253.1 ATP-binding protein [Aliarcobacter cryaerophilus]MCT7511923.1 ATP-binding protein [Aliarcobacter cryaerophilus]MCT7517276.1 ATP-binding protein [Aliarcobacter cryaerophilus]MCT7523451.1 ATP-binding protein [Aliarcobacter cryaerophilus]
MLKIHQLFLRTYLAIFVAILITVTLSTYFWAKNLYLNQVEKNLIQNIDILSVILEDTKDINSIKDIIKDLSKKLNLRISIINENGEVVAESHKNIEDIKNHSNRVEIIEARNIGLGKDTRVSETLNKDLIYIAKKVSFNEEIYYLRMADYTNKITDNFKKLTFEIFIYISFFLIIAFISTYFISIKIQRETDSILYFLKEITNKKKPIFLQSNYTFEFYKIAKLLNKVAKKISKKDEIKAKHTAKLTLANRQKDDIISAISHEFKNPIAIISGYSQTLIEDENLSQTLKIKFLNKILSNSNKMSQIVDKLRLTLKLQDNNHKLILNKVSIKKIVENSISDLKIKYKNREIKVFGVDKEINADEILIGIAISNLIENALKYSQEDVIIEINENSISITDKGIGISQENLENIFKKYYRATSNNWNNSLGLGLFIVKSILNVHNFKLEINSKIGNGSTFKIYY